MLFDGADGRSRMDGHHPTVIRHQVLFQPKVQLHRIERTLSHELVLLERLIIPTGAHVCDRFFGVFCQVPFNPQLCFPDWIATMADPIHPIADPTLGSDHGNRQRQNDENTELTHGIAL